MMGVRWAARYTSAYVVPYETPPASESWSDWREDAPIQLADALLQRDRQRSSGDYGYWEHQSTSQSDDSSSGWSTDSDEDVEHGDAISKRIPTSRSAPADLARTSVDSKPGARDVGEVANAPQLHAAESKPPALEEPLAKPPMERATTVHILEHTSAQRDSAHGRSSGTHTRPGSAHRLGAVAMRTRSFELLGLEASSLRQSAPVRPRSAHGRHASPLTDEPPLRAQRPRTASQRERAAASQLSVCGLFERSHTADALPQLRAAGLGGSQQPGMPLGVSSRCASVLARARTVPCSRDVCARQRPPCSRAHTTAHLLPIATLALRRTRSERLATEPGRPSMIFWAQGEALPPRRPLPLSGGGSGNNLNMQKWQLQEHQSKRALLQLQAAQRPPRPVTAGTRHAVGNVRERLVLHARPAAPLPPAQHALAVGGGAIPPSSAGLTQRPRSAVPLRMRSGAFTTSGYSSGAPPPYEASARRQDAYPDILAFGPGAGVAYARTTLRIFEPAETVGSFLQPRATTLQAQQQVRAHVAARDLHGRSVRKSLRRVQASASLLGTARPRRLRSFLHRRYVTACPCTP